MSVPQNEKKVVTQEELQAEFEKFQSKYWDVFTWEFKTRDLASYIEKVIDETDQNALPGFLEEYKANNLSWQSLSWDNGVDFSNYLFGFRNATEKLLKEIKLSPEERALVAETLKAASTFIDAVHYEVKPKERPKDLVIPLVQDAARNLQTCVNAANKKMEKKAWRNWTGALSMLAGGALIIAGFFMSEVGIGIAMIASGVGLVGVGMRLTTETKKEENSSRLQIAADVLNQRARFFFNQPIKESKKEEDPKKDPTNNNKSKP